MPKLIFRAEILQEGNLNDIPTEPKFRGIRK
jgi:hypothetical protein